jgi:PadR family transcriptional regulator, regulatory protein AphA
MEYHLIEKPDGKYVACQLPNDGLQSERDALDLLSICGEFEVHNLLLEAGSLGETFTNLRSGVAGDVLLKFVNYYMRVAAVMTPEEVGDGRFSEFASETNKGAHFRIFYKRTDAEAWLLSGAA